ncbi:MAG: DegT/DnrJ/EryC1/StrS family aminotransferase, partial [Candidatus Lokiarchaeota archaeon]|nr:DegT/DnrJ/EryC1/StrS family aminotransferase [Candidatus Lokiarchaeota archaeon]
MNAPTSPVKYDLQTRFGTMYGEEEKAAIAECLARDAPTSGKRVIEFEKRFAEMCKTRHAIAVSNGTAALLMACKAIDIKAGDEVITTPVTWIATAASAVVLGAKVKFCDVNPSTMNMDPETIKPLITKKTRAIIPVHLYGRSVDMDPISELAARHGLHVIEDSAHAPGGNYHGKMTGSIGSIGCFSFHEQKNMSTLGEGGMVTTNDDSFNERVRSYKSHCTRVFGQSTKYLPLDESDHASEVDKGRYWFQDFDDCGYNVRMTDVQGAVGLCQLKKLAKLNGRRQEIAAFLSEELGKLPGLESTGTIPRAESVYHLFLLFIEKGSKVSRDQFVYKLHQDFGIRCGTHYMPLVHVKAFKDRGHSPRECPVACERWERLVTLPCHPRMAQEHLDYLVDSIKRVV